MLFNSYIFVFVFFPIVLTTYYSALKYGSYRLAISFLIAASLFYYAWWNPRYVVLIIFSILVNYGIGSILCNRNNASKGNIFLMIGVGLNLGLLGYYKYADFFIENINSLAGIQISLQNIILPLAISFFTFQQIAYLVDTYKCRVEEYSFLDYCLFVLFFPQLIAGPIVHHKEMMPQFTNKINLEKFNKNISIGISIFVIGLFKKVIIADTLGENVNPVFEAAENGHVLTLVNAWCGALGYTFQLYYDFSGYSDMAIGIARMFGIILPLNFFSPYKAVSVTEFWRRWHITLSRFLRDYLYIPLGGNRKGTVRQTGNILVTMLLGGLWHGASWTFVVWGGLHGIYLVIEKAIFNRNILFNSNVETSIIKMLRIVITFILIVVAWVFFRAETFSGAVEILKGMIGLNGFVLPESYYGYLNRILNFGDVLAYSGAKFDALPYFSGINQILMIVVAWAIAWLLPNTYQIFSNYNPALIQQPDYMPVNTRLKWSPSTGWAIIMALLAIITFISMNKISEFLYYQF